MAARDQLTWEENLVAFVGGGGLLLAMAGGALVGFGSDTDLARLLAYVGIALVVLAIALWLVLLQPWRKFDDLQTPYYTGHHHDHDEDHEDHAEATLETVDGGGAVSATATPEVVETEPVAETPVEEPEPVPKKPIAETKAKVKTEPTKTEEPIPVSEETVPAEPDNLKLIEGIGPKVSDALNASGISTFAQLASMTPAEVERIVKGEHKVRVVGSVSTWVRQAKLAALGDASALDDLKKRIKSGYLYDDLTEIEGIGPKAQDALYEARIRSFDDLAAASIKDIEKALKKAKLDMNPETWSKQAQFIAADDLTGLKKYQDTLNN